MIPQGITLDRPPDVTVNGCLSCGGPALLVHGTARQRYCDRCGAEWNGPEWGYQLALAMLGGNR